MLQGMGAIRFVLNEVLDGCFQYVSIHVSNVSVCPIIIHQLSNFGRARRSLVKELFNKAQNRNKNARRSINIHLLSLINERAGGHLRACCGGWFASISGEEISSPTGK
jgi:hypothetical protein